MACSLSPASAQPENGNPQVPDMADIVLPPADEIEPEYLQEMNMVYEKCNREPFTSGHRSCQCYAMRFLEERLDAPGASQNALYNRIEQDCYDKAAMAGYYYGVCINMNMDTDIRDWETPCSCFGNRMAETASRYQSLNYVMLGTLQTRAYNSCNVY